jgi:hypothetical protein
MHPRRLEKNANITLKSALLPQAVFTSWKRNGLLDLFESGNPSRLATNLPLGINNGLLHSAQALKARNSELRAEKLDS